MRDDSCLERAKVGNIMAHNTVECSSTCSIAQCEIVSQALNLCASRAQCAPILLPWTQLSPTPEYSDCTHLQTPHPSELHQSTDMQRLMRAHAHDGIKTKRQQMPRWPQEARRGVRKLPRRLRPNKLDAQDGHYALHLNWSLHKIGIAKMNSKQDGPSFRTATCFGLLHYMLRVATLSRFFKRADTEYLPEPPRLQDTHSEAGQNNISTFWDNGRGDEIQNLVLDNLCRPRAAGSNYSCNELAIS